MERLQLTEDERYEIVSALRNKAAGDRDAAGVLADDPKEGVLEKQYAEEYANRSRTGAVAKAASSSSTAGRAGQNEAAESDFPTSGGHHVC